MYTISAGQTKMTIALTHARPSEELRDKAEHDDTCVDLTAVTGQVTVLCTATP